MKVEKKSFEPHPLGWFLFCLGEPSVISAEDNKMGKERLCWPCESSETMESGDRYSFNLYTGVSASTHPSDKHRQLVEDGFGIRLEDYDDTDQIVNRVFAGKVDKNPETKRVSIVQFDTRDRLRPADKKAKGKSAVDPFAEE